MAGVMDLVAPRYKAVAATVVPLVGGVLFLVSTNELDLQHVAGLLAVALGAGGLTHALPNKTVAAADDTVAEVTGTANNVVTAVDDGVESVTGGVLGKVGKLLNRKPKP